MRIKLQENHSWRGGVGCQQEDEVARSVRWVLAELAKRKAPLSDAIKAEGFAEEALQSSWENFTCSLK